MISYTSTRGDNTTFTFSQAILQGTANDGGLFVPKAIPQFNLAQLQFLANKTYQRRAQFVFDLFQTDFKKQTIQEIITKAYGSNFDVPEIAPLVHLKDKQYIVELWHGPTAAFKDMALQILPLCFSEAVNILNKQRKAEKKKPLTYLILVATSGDTGKAALEGYKDKEHIGIIVFYPDKRVSKLQELQMTTQDGKNVGVFALNGDFDSVQRIVKEIFIDEQFRRKLFTEESTILSSANSINFGRIVPQIIYHISSYIDLARTKYIKWGDLVDMVVPSGNFGNLLAAYYAKNMGLPIRKLVCASNENNSLTEFLQTGVYDLTKRRLVRTPSPSMDILLANNIERLLYTITQDSEKVAAYMHDLKTKRTFTVDKKILKVLQRDFFADWVSNGDCLANIKSVYEETGYLMDTHTSVAQVVAQRFIDEQHDATPLIIASTAHWSKFASSVYHALRPEAKLPQDEFAALQAVCDAVPEAKIPENIHSLQSRKVRFSQKSDTDKSIIEDLILNWLNKR